MVRSVRYGTVSTLAPHLVVPPLPSGSAYGNGWLSVDPVARSIRYEISWYRLTSATQSVGFYRGATGQVGPLLHTLNISGINQSGENSGDATGVWENIPVEDFATFLAGGIYVNVLSVGKPQGEVRNQLSPVNFYSTAISSLNEVPPVTAAEATGAGTGYLDVSVTSEGAQLSGVFYIAGTTGPVVGAHLHGAYAGTNGPIVRTLNRVSTDGLFLLSGDMTTDSVPILNARGTYINFHTDLFPDGEVRGQLIPAATNLVTAVSSAPIEAPATESVTGTYDRAGGTLRFDLPDEVMPKGGRLRLHDILGRVVSEMEISGSEAVMDAGMLPAGVYIAYVTVEGSPVGSCRVAVTR